MTKQVTYKHGRLLRTVSRGRLRKNYSSFQEFEYYSDIYSLADRLGYESAESAWRHNPIIEWSTNPDDYRKAPRREPTKKKG